MNKRISYGFMALVLRLLVAIAIGRRPLPNLTERAAELADECEAIADGRATE